MTLTEVRTYVGRLTRSGADTDRYSATDTDLAAATLGNRLINEMGTTAKTTVAITADTDTVSFAGITGFRPSRLLRARVTVSASYTDYAARKGVAKVGYDDVLRMRGECDRTGVPEYIGFSATTAAEVYPTPQYTGTLTVWTRDSFVSFTPGTGSPGSVTINVPDDLIYDWLQAVADYVELDSVEARREYLRSPDWRDFILRARGTASLGGSVITRELE